ncbi:MAG TPA: DKNYY domain-containing protein [Oligoflexus sp.]|uniref:DKNYY domain-containing protein n=1 Tax=Oligoflexus sp. TaxID=1971216 RepID=UPI002D2506BB|nr:DKNYY domain-containing protein [Oligoflexus sp.]HYX34885.1 DKNYY domain-containing protein [Oligoflexus sp.]
MAVYYQGERLIEADPGSFEALNVYARDKTRVYFGGQVMEGIDPSSFVELTAGWAKDRSHALYKGGIVEGADPASLTVDKVDPDYALDSRQVFYKGNLMPGVDPLGFTCIDRRFCKNTTQVLFMNSLVSDVDAATFTVDSCSTEYPKPLNQMLCTAPRPSLPQLVVCQVHDKNRSFSLERKL